MSTFRCAASVAARSWISQIQVPGKPGSPTSSGSAWNAAATFGRRIPSRKRPIPSFGPTAGGNATPATIPKASRFQVQAGIGISVSGGHINYAYAKMNDTYYSPGSSYDTTAWRALVMCQEIGHDFGLHHQDQNFNNANLGTCMDYTSDPGSNQHPNNHDYQMLADIYAHLDPAPEDPEPDPESDTGGPCRGGPKRGCAPPAFDMELADIGQWGELIGTSEDGGQSTFRPGLRQRPPSLHPRDLDLGSCRAAERPTLSRGSASASRRHAL